jgi:RimJ/RimL family protein N-acetyltransferase
MFPTEYACLIKQRYRMGGYELVPIRYEDRWNIMQWRNEQMYHLRQNHILTEDEQEQYFTQIIAGLFTEDKPPQILFSYLKEGQCIGYGGLVHINWIDKHAEISFLMNTELEQEDFVLHWKNYLWLLEEIAFEQLGFHKIFTYAYDLRPRLYQALNKSRFKEEARLIDHCCLGGKYVDVLIHSKFNTELTYRLFDAGDKSFIFDLNNDPESRENSFYPNAISIQEHDTWFAKRLADEETVIYVCQQAGKSIGIVRFQKEGDQATVGINIIKDMRAHGLAKRILKHCCEDYFLTHDVEILAYIKPGNVASIRSFEYAGFHYQNETQVNGYDAVVYNLMKYE